MIKKIDSFLVAINRSDVEILPAPEVIVELRGTVCTLEAEKSAVTSQRDGSMRDRRMDELGRTKGGER